MLNKWASPRKLVTSSLQKGILGSCGVYNRDMLVVVCAVDAV